MEQVVRTSTPRGSEAGAARLMLQRNDGPVGGSADGTSVRTDTAQNHEHERETEPTSSGYSADERAAIDEANEAFAPIIDAIDKLEDVEGWAPPLVRGVRALRDRAMRDTGALNYLDNEYRKTFGDLLNAEPIGPWLLDNHSLLNAVHYLGTDDSYLETFIDWRAKIITEKQRKNWRSLRILVDHFKEWQSSSSPTKERRTSVQKEIERVRTEGHKAEAALLAEVEQTRRELATQAIESTDTLWAILEEAGPEGFVESLRDHDAKDYARAVYNLLAAWFKEPTG
jgi:hypothetical protein